MIVQNVSDHGMTDISFTVPHDDLDTAMEVAPALAAEIGAAGVAADDGIGRVSLVGAGMKSNPGVAATMFETLAERRDQHRDDLHLGHPHLLRRRRGRPRTSRPGAPRRVRLSRRLTTA